MSRRDSHRRYQRAARSSVDELAEQVLAASVTCWPELGWAARNAAALVERAAGGPIELAATVALGTILGQTWADGWQPVDLWQLARRRMDSPAVDFVVGAIAEEAARYARASLHPRWRAQLTELGASIWWGPDECHVAAFADRNGLDRVAVLTLVLELLAQLRALRHQPRLIPPPGAYHGAEGLPDVDRPEVDPKILAKVRGLLAKAESTDFPEEADAFFAKAQELMSRYSLERAAVETLTGSGPTKSRVRTDGRRIWLDNPYLRAKSMLVGAVAEANRCRAVFAESIGFVTVIGEETDTEIVEVLSTSLLVQAGRAMLAAGGRVSADGQSRTRSFRRAFLISYAQRIGERLRSAAAVAEAEVAESVGGELLPVLAAREHAVAERVAQLFPRLVSRRVTVSNSAGWVAGRAAADLAVLDVRRALRA